MKRHLIRIAASVGVLLSVGAGAAEAATLYSPYKGVLCDRKSGFCADREGISMGLTKLYLGTRAEQKLMDRRHQVGPDKFDTGEFTTSNGITCKAKQQACYTRRDPTKIDTRTTGILFGE